VEQPKIKKIGRNTTVVEQIHTYLLQLIKDGLLKPGKQLPSEPELARQLSVSRISLREALQKLEAEGAIARKRGVGTFVIGPPAAIQVGFERLHSLSGSLVSKGRTPGTTKTLIETEPADEQLAQDLNLEPGHEMAVIKRLRTIDGKPLCWNIDYLSRERLPEDISPKDLGLSLYNYLETQCGIFINHTSAHIYPALCDTALSKILNTPEGTLLIKVVQTHYLADNTPVLFSVQWFLNSEFDLVVSRTR
jgi:GntR family transcriptional regulator